MEREVSVETYWNLNDTNLVMETLEVAVSVETYWNLNSVADTKVTFSSSYQ